MYFLTRTVNKTEFLIVRPWRLQKLVGFSEKQTNKQNKKHTEKLLSFPHIR